MTNKCNFVVKIILIFLMYSITNLNFVSASATPIEKDEKVFKVRNEGPLFTAYNMWYETGKENAMWCINYKKGAMIPAATEVKDVRIVEAETGRFQGGSGLAISFITVDDEQKYMVNFNQKFHPGTDIEDYLDRMFTNKTFDQLTEGMTAKEIEGIKKGVVKIGMSKQAVIISYGYPPEHKTGSPDEDVWIYWMSRFQSKPIHFDENNLAYRPVIDSDEL